MNIFSSLMLFLFISFTGFTQTLHIVLIDATTKLPVKAVKVKSMHDHDLITFSNDSGYFAYGLKHSDTIMLQKDYYYPVYMSLSSHKFDSTHVIRIPLTPSESIYKGSNQFKSMNLQAFEYHFTHDDIAGSQANITIFQTKEEINVRRDWNDKSFKFATVDIFTHTNKGKSSYVEKQSGY